MSGSIICIIIIMISYLLICQDKPEYQEYQVIIVTIITISILNVFSLSHYRLYDFTYKTVWSVSLFSQLQYI